jgi:cell division protein FtsI (penicillin-binding protein 3)
VDIIGEGSPEIKYPGDEYWSGISLAMMSHGYEIRLTPLQTLAFYNAIANDGKMVKPIFVKELRYHGRTVKRFSTEVLKSSICSRSTLKKVQQILKGVVESGTATNLKNDQISIAGKTGTNQIYNTEYGYKSASEVSYQASFVGYFPADDPLYSCIVVVNSPSKNVYYGNQVAGPVFLEIAKKVYATSIEMHPALQAGRNAPPEVPFTKDGSKDELNAVLKELDHTVENRNIGASWVNTTKLEHSISLEQRELIENLVPNVVGMGLKDALYLLENAGFQVEVNGYGSVKSQSISPGMAVRKGGKISLEMSFI